MKMASREEKLNKAHSIIAKITKNLYDLADIFVSDHVEEHHLENKKKRRDPNAPKPPTSNFFLFCNSIRDEVERENSEATFAEKSKLYGARWQKLSEEERMPFTELAKKEREKYNKEMAAYEAGEKFDQPAEKKVKKDSSAAKAKSIPAKATAKVTPAKAAAPAKSAKKDIKEEPVSSDSESGSSNSDSDSGSSNDSDSD